MDHVEPNEIKRYCLILLFAVCSVCCGDDNKQAPGLRSFLDEYYYTNNNQATTRFSSIMYNLVDSVNPVERFKMIHISDAHISSWSSDNHYTNPKNLIEAVSFANQSRLRINAMVATGDHISDNKRSDALGYMNVFFENLYADNRIPTFPCYGNHDANIYMNNRREYLTPQELYNAFDNKGNYALQREFGNSYYYADVPNPMGGMIRFISLHMIDQPSNQHDTLHDAVYSGEQINWLGNVALKEGMTDSHCVIVLNHFPFQPKWGKYMSNEMYLHSWRMIPEIIEAFRTKQTIRKTYFPYWTMENGDSSFSPISIDFDFSVTPGDFICYMGGHAHVTAQFDITGLTNQSEDFLPQKMLLCTNMSPSEKGTAFNKVDRRSQSLSNNSFCLYAIDTQERNIYITFFGAYLPANLSESEYPKIQVIPY